MCTFASPAAPLLPAARARRCPAKAPLLLPLPPALPSPALPTSRPLGARSRGGPARGAGPAVPAAPTYARLALWPRVSSVSCTATEGRAPCARKQTPWAAAPSVPGLPCQAKCGSHVRRAGSRGRRRRGRAQHASSQPIPPAPAPPPPPPRPPFPLQLRAAHLHAAPPRLVRRPPRPVARAVLCR